MSIIWDLTMFEEKIESVIIKLLMVFVIENKLLPLKIKKKKKIQMNIRLKTLVPMTFPIKLTLVI